MATLRNGNSPKGVALLLRILTAAGIFVGLFVLLLLALMLISCGIITLPSAIVRLFAFSELFVSSIPPLTMLFCGSFMLFGGAAVILFTSSRLCPAAAQYLFRIFSGGNIK